MPAIILQLLRTVIMSLVTGAAVTAIQETVDGTAKTLVSEIKDKEGVTEQDSKDIIHNILVDLAINSLTVGTLLKTRLPVKTADYLGFSTKNLAKKKLTGKAATAAATLAANGGGAVVKSSIPKILKIAAIPGSFIWLISAIANIVEPGVYKPEQTNAVYRKLGIPFQYPEPQSSAKPGPFSSDSSVTFDDFYKSLEASGAVGIEDPYALQSRVLTKQNLADLVNAIYGSEILKGKAPSVKELIPIVGKYIVTNKSKATTVIPTSSKTTSSNKGTSSPTPSSGITNLSQYYASIGQSLPSVSARSKIYEQMGLGQAAFYTGTAEQNTKLLQALLGKRTVSVPAPSTPTSTPAPTLAPTETKNVPVVPAPPTQVFMGVVAGGTLSNNVVFTERPDDLIESFDEFQHAAANNLSSFLLALTNRISYELKIVPSVVTSGGFRQTGTTNRYITGYNKDGSPKYKTVTNKFATLTIYILNDKNTRTKVGTIVLGPTDSSKITPTQTDLRQLEALIQNSIVTRNIDDISRIETKTPTTIVPPTDGTTDQTPTTGTGSENTDLTVKVEPSLLDFWTKYLPDTGSAGSDYGTFVNRGGTFYRVSDNARAVAS